jgi:hypothetical protein
MGLHRLVGPGSVSEPPRGEHSYFQTGQVLIKMVPPAVREESVSAGGMACPAPSGEHWSIRSRGFSFGSWER